MFFEPSARTRWAKLLEAEAGGEAQRTPPFVANNLVVVVVEQETAHRPVLQFPGPYHGPRLCTYGIYPA